MTRILESSGDANEGERIWQVLGPNVTLVDKMLVLEGEDASTSPREQEQSTATQQTPLTSGNVLPCACTP